MNYMQPWKGFMCPLSFMPDREKDVKDHIPSRPLSHYLGPRLYTNTFHRFLPESYRGARGSRVLCLKCKAVFHVPTSGSAEQPQGKGTSLCCQVCRHFGRCYDCIKKEGSTMSSAPAAGRNRAQSGTLPWKAWLLFWGSRGGSGAAVRS